MPPRPSDNRVLSNFSLSHQHSSGGVAFASDFSAPTGGCHLYAGDRGISLTRDHQLVPVSLVRSNGAPALAGSYLVDMIHGATDFSVDENLVENSLQQIQLAGAAKLETGDLLGTPPCPFLRVPVESLLSDDDSASASTLAPPTTLARSSRAQWRHIRLVSPPRRPARTPLSTTWMNSPP